LVTPDKHRRTGYYSSASFRLAFKAKKCNQPALHSPLAGDWRLQRNRRIYAAFISREIGKST